MSRRSLRILTWLGIAVVLGGTYSWFFGFQTMMILETRRMARKAPVVRLTPRSLPDSSRSTAIGKKLSYFGYDFEVPWDDLDDSQTKAGPNWVVLRFRSGYAMKFTSVPPGEFVNGVLEHTDKGTFRQLCGDAPLRSDYAMWRLIIDTTPDKVTLRSSRKEAAAVPMLLLIKAIAAPEESGLFAIQTEDFNGFQWGDPRAHPKRIFVDLYSDDGGLEFAFLGPTKGPPWSISQPEINRVWQTLRKVPQDPRPHPEQGGASSSTVP